MNRDLKIDHIRNDLAASRKIYERGENLYHLGGYALIDVEDDPLTYTYSFTGTHGEYEVVLREEEGEAGEGHFDSSCTCPYPERGCKHTVAAYLDLSGRKKNEAFPEYRSSSVPDRVKEEVDESIEVLTPEEVMKAAVDARFDRSFEESLSLSRGDLFRGQHTVRGEKGKAYTVTVYDSESIQGHCTCADFASSNLGMCKHLIFTHRTLRNTKKGEPETRDESFPFIHLTWDSRMSKPVIFYDQIVDDELRSTIQSLFTPITDMPIPYSTPQHKKNGRKRGAPLCVTQRLGVYTESDMVPLYRLYESYLMTEEGTPLLFDDHLLEKMNTIFYEKEMERSTESAKVDLSFLKVSPYPYQKEGIVFSALRKSTLIADEMGLGKTLQAIAVAVVKKQLFGFSKTLVVCPASLKSQWAQEIQKFTDEECLVIAGSRDERRGQYLSDESFFKITNYEALMRDITTVDQWSPDFVILDEAQRIKNFETKTHQAINALPRTHALVITGTPLENKLEDLYSIMQFCAPGLLTPLWAFAATHYRLSRDKKNKIVGYRNLDVIHEKLKDVLIRRTKKEVFESLPEITQNTYTLPLHPKQTQIHQGYMSGLMQIIEKKFISPVDLLLMQKLLQAMRMVCDSTFLVDKKTSYSPKLSELSDIIEEEVIGNRRKAVIFTEWTMMENLVSRQLEEKGIRHILFNGKVPVAKRQVLIDEFRDDPDCLVFLSTDAGGVGLNLQNCDLLINVELPWNPARLNQRIGRIHRIGQSSSKVNVINLVSKNSIEEKILAGIHMKQELFNAVLTGSADAVEFSREEQNRFLSQIRELFQEEIEKGVESSPSFINELIEEQTEQEMLSEDETSDPISTDSVSEKTGSSVDIEGEEPEEPALDIAKDSEVADIGEESEDMEEKKEPSPQMEDAQLEAVLNQGLSFLNTLTMATSGKALFSGDSDGNHISIDREKGEVVLRFKL